MLASRKRLTGAAALAVVASGLLIPSSPASANPGGTGLVINEVYGGGGNSGAPLTNDFVELYNPTASAISVNGMSLQYRSAAGTGVPGASNVFALPNKTVQPGGYFLVQLAAGTTVTDKPLPQTPDASSPAGTMALSGTGGQIFLASSATGIDPGTGTISNGSVVDFVGWGTSTTSYEGTVVPPATRNSAPATTNSTSISRTSPGHDTDSNSADFAAAAAPTPTAGAVVVTPLDATSPGNKSGFQGVAITGFTLQATGGTPPYSWNVTGLPNGVSATSAGVVSGTPLESGTFPATATVTDSASPTPAQDSVTFDIVVDEAPDLIPIAEIQGTGARSPLAPASGNASGTEVVTTEGVVTARYPAGGFNGMYIQTPGDDTADASDGIFVYAGSANANIPAGIEVGDSVQVTGPIAEFFDLTQIVPASAGAVVELGSSLGTITPRAIAFPTTTTGREAREGELLAPTGSFTVSNNFQTNQFAEIGLATGTTPLRQWTEFASPHDVPAIDAIKADNAARAVTLDDGATTNFLSNQTNKAIPLPWLTQTSSVRVGAAVTFTGPVVLDWRNNVWKFQPDHQVTGNGAEVATFQDTRATNLAPQSVGGDLKIATFNVLNYFNTTGEAYVDAGPLQNPPIDTHCAYFTDRESNRIGNDQCGVRQPGETYTSSNPNDGRGPRGAATAASLARQEAKLAHAINLLNADVIGLEEVENSIKLPGESNRDDALARIVQLVNADAGETKWAYVKSPGEALTASAVAEQDVIRPAFIYQIAKAKPVGQSDILFGTSQFANAREPLAQAFKAAGAPDSDAFAVIVNHFKSKGDNAGGAPPATGDNANDTVTGVGAFNGDRVRQAERLVQFADDFAADRDIEAVFLAGDFNAYTMEDPITTLEDGGYELIDSTDANDESYSFSGLSGSLDHVLGNEAAADMVTGADIWEINADEPVAYQYSRYNYNATILFDPAVPFATSDHNPEIVGINVPDFEETTYREIQILGTNDFHGRLLPDGGNAAGAAPFATAVKELKEQVPDSIFVAAGDLVGASTFESFIQDDEPTIDALNAMDLEVSAAGNHEFDRGYADFVGRIQDRADWEYIAANVNEPEGQDQLAPTFTKTFGTGEDAVKVGFVGAVTEDLPALVNPDLIEGVTVTDVVDATNDAAADLKAAGADLVVLLVHEGSPSTDCSSPSFTDDATTWGNIVQHASPNVDAIISGHTHLAYNCRYPVAGWEGRAVTKRPVVSAGQYGTNLNQLVFKLDPDTGELAAITQDVVATAGVGYAPDPTVDGIVQDAVAFAETAGAAVLGKMGGPFRRAQYLPASGATENRGGESTLGNQVAEVQRWATDEAGIDTDIAFMNPGGLRADMVGTLNGAVRDLTYRQAADVQPFANTLVNMKLTGAQIETVLEQQWQRNAQGGVPSRPFLRLGVSDGFTYTYVETPQTVTAPNSAPVSTFRGEVTGMWLNGVPIDPEATYGVTVNSFLGSGGDNFWELANGTQKVDTGKIDLEAMVDFMAEHDAANPLVVDYSQRGVEVTFPGDAPATYAPGGTVTFDVASWAMSATGDQTDSSIQVKLGATNLGTPATVNNTIGTQPYDNYGTASVSVTLPADVPDGKATLKLVGATTGTEIPVEIQVDDGTEDIQILATNDFHGRIVNDSASAAAGAAVMAGAVKQLKTANPNTVFAAAGDLIGASTFESFIQNDKPTIDALNEAGLEVSAVGNHELDQGYDDLINRVMAEYDADTNAEGGAEWQYIAANLKIKATGDPAVPATWIKDMSGVQVGFVGAVTEDLPSLVNPDGIAELEVTGIVSSVNTAATDLKTAGADVVVMLVHEGSPGTSCATMSNPATAWGSIVTNVSADVDAIVSGHTHLEYNCSFPVAAWEGRPVTERPVVSAGQYGANLNQLVFTVDPETGQVVAKSQALLKLKSCTNSAACTNYPADSATATIVSEAVADAVAPGNVVLGNIEAPFARAKFSDAALTENRGGESTLGNLVAEVQRWATPATVGGADIAFMNPGGLRQDMVGNVVEGERQVTYRQAANVQPFANTLVNLDLTGAQIKTVLEQQWQRTASNALPVGRIFLRLGVSEGFTYTYTQAQDPAQAAGVKKGTVTGMWLDGEPIDLGETYSVTVNSFLAGGGDNFRELANGTGKQDTGVTDLQAMVDYMDAFGADPAAVPIDRTQHAVDVTFPVDAPASYAPGEHVVFDLASLSMTDPGDQRDTAVQVFVGDTPVGGASVTTTITDSPGSGGVNSNDNAGTAHVDFALPSDVPAGDVVLRVVGNNTGTQVLVPIEVETGAAVSVEGPTSVSWATGTAFEVSVAGNEGTVTGSVRLFEGAEALSASTDLVDGEATLTLAAKALEPGEHTLRVEYTGNYPNSSTEVALTVTTATPTVTAENASMTYGEAKTVTVHVPEDATGTVQLRSGGTLIGEAGDVVDGEAEVTIPGDALEPPAATLTADYSGDGHYAAGMTTFNVTIDKITSTVTAPDVSLTYGQAKTVTVEVDEDATGTVQLSLNGVDIGTAATVTDGEAEATIPAGALEPGAHDLLATYSGDAHYKGGTDELAATVAKATPTVTATNVSFTYGSSAVVTVKVEPATAAGTVSIFEGSKKIGTTTVVGSGGIAKVTLPAKSLTPGTKTLKATYSGDGRYLSVTDTFTATIAKAASTTNAKVSPTSVKVKKGQATVSVTVTGPSGVPVTGSVKIAVAGQATKTVVLKNGKATLKLAKFSTTGLKKITVSYVGSDLLKPSTDTVTLKVVK